MAVACSMVRRAIEFSSITWRYKENSSGQQWPYLITQIWSNEQIEIAQIIVILKRDNALDLKRMEETAKIFFRIEKMELCVETVYNANISKGFDFNRNAFLFISRYQIFSKLMLIFNYNSR